MKNTAQQTFSVAIADLGKRPMHHAEVFAHSSTVRSQEVSRHLLPCDGGHSEVDGLPSDKSSLTRSSYRSDLNFPR